MACIATSYAPLILEPDAANDWTKQHVLSEHLRQAEHKQPTTTTTSTSTSTSSTASKRSSNHHHYNHNHNQHPSKRLRHQPSHLLLHIPGPQPTTTTRIHKAAITPTTKTPTKPPQHWAALLTSATHTLQSIYAATAAANTTCNIPSTPSLPPPPPAPLRRRSSSTRSDEFEGLDRIQLASRAMQMAAGFAWTRARHDDDDYDESSASESEVEAPATPVGVGEGVMMDIDPALFS